MHCLNPTLAKDVGQLLRSLQYRAEYGEEESNCLIEKNILCKGYRQCMWLEVIDGLLCDHEHWVPCTAWRIGKRSTTRMPSLLSLRVLYYKVIIELLKRTWKKTFQLRSITRSHFCLPGWFQYPDNESSACVDQHLLHPTLFLSLCLYQMLTQSTHGLIDSNMHKVHFLHFFFGRGSGKLGGWQTWLIGPQICLSRQVRYSSRTDNINMWQSLFIEYFVKKKHFFKTTLVLSCLKNRFLQS